MEKIAVVLMKEPYADINAAEAIRHALGAVGEELQVSLVLAEGGTLLAKKGQEEGSTGFTNLGNALKDCLDMDISVYADSKSLERERLKETDIIEGVQVISTTRASEIIRDADKTFIF